MPYIALWIHIVWATHERRPVLTATLRPLLFQHLREQAQRHQIRLTDVGGWYDHVHIICALGPDQTLAKTIQLLKGESSHWLNAHKLTSEPFRWQAEYWAGSVSPSGLPRVRAYVARQEAHHRTLSFADECERLFKGLGILPQHANRADSGMG